MKSGLGMKIALGPKLAVAEAEGSMHIQASATRIRYRTRIGSAKRF